MAAAAGVESPVKGDQGHPANALVYGEYITDVAPDSCTVGSPEVSKIVDGVYDALCDDLNTPTALSHLFDAVRLVNTAKEGKAKLGKDDLQALLRLFDDIVFGVLALKDDGDSGKAGKTIDGLMKMVLESRAAAKEARDWATSDRIRDDLAALGIKVKDTKDGAEWTME